MTVALLQGVDVANSKAQVLSRRVWDILMMIPGSPAVMSDFKNISPENPRLSDLMDPQKVQKLYYALYVIHALGRTGLSKMVSLKATLAPVMHK